MSKALWTPAELLASVAGRPTPAHPIVVPVTGVSIDTRTLQAGDLYVAIKGDVHDGHDFVGKAFQAGAAAALVRDGFASAEGPLIHVEDPLAAMCRLGAAARARNTGTIFAVTGSVGKTGTKEALKACLSALGPTHAAEKSYNNHWGVPLTLSRLPAAARFGVFEIGMNHAGEITPLTALVRPHIAIVTTVGPVHIEFFPSEEAIADAKAEIFSGLVPGGTAIINADNRHAARLTAAALAVKARIVTFGADQAANVRLADLVADPLGTNVHAMVHGRPLRFRLGMPGRHHVENALAVVAALDAAGLDLALATAPLATLSPGAGRGERTHFAVPGGPVLLIDESYNANPSSMRAALAALGEVPRDPYRRRIAVIGDMRELGEHAPELHRELAAPLAAHGIDRVVAVGPFMEDLFAQLLPGQRALYAARSEEVIPGLLTLIAPGDAIMIKGSLGTRMAPIVDALKSHLASLVDHDHKG